MYGSGEVEVEASSSLRGVSEFGLGSKWVKGRMLVGSGWETQEKEDGTVDVVGNDDKSEAAVAVKGCGEMKESTCSRRRYC